MKAAVTPALLAVFACGSSGNGSLVANATADEGVGAHAQPGVGGGSASGAPSGPPSGGVTRTGGRAIAARRFARGINFGNRLDAPREGDWGPLLHTGDFAAAAQRGFDHIRLPVRFSAHASTVAPFTLDSAILARVDWAVQSALDAGLSIIIDLHHYDELQRSPAQERERFLALWAQLAVHYQQAPPGVAFELLNEPSGMMDSPTWNDLAQAAVTVIRVTNPQRLLFIDSVRFASAETLATLDVSGENLAAVVHLYEPTLFTFQGQAWMGPVWATTGVVFPGPPSTPLTPAQAASDTPWANAWFEDYNTLPTSENPSGPKAIERQIGLARAFSARTGWSVYNGEWGPQNLGDTPSRARYVAAMRQACDAASIGWAIWEDGGSMKLLYEGGRWDEDILGVLLPR